MLIIEYIDDLGEYMKWDKDYVHVYSDLEMIDTAKHIYDLFKMYSYTNWKTTQELLILAFRVLVFRGDIPCSDIKFRYKDQEICVDKLGKLDKSPYGFCGTHSKLVDELVC